MVRFTATDQFTFNNRNIQMVTAGINYKFGGWGWSILTAIRLTKRTAKTPGLYPGFLFADKASHP